jgi:hypothetical protein
MTRDRHKRVPKAATWLPEAGPALCISARTSAEEGGSTPTHKEVMPR